MTECRYCHTTEGRIEASGITATGNPVCDACEDRLERAESIAHDLLAGMDDGFSAEYVEAHETAADLIRALRPLSWILRQVEDWPDSVAWITTACGTDWPRG